MRLLYFSLVLKISIDAMEQMVTKNSVLDHRLSVSIKHGLRTTDYGLGLKHRLGYKTRTKHYGLGIKYRLGYKTRTEHYGLGIKYGLGYEQAHTGRKLHPLSVLRAKATSSKV